MNYIYELIDPRSNEIWYVGITNDLKVRYSHHLSNSSSGGPEKIRWIKELVSKGLKPIMNVREEIEDREEALLRERHWILKYLEEGKALVNVSYGVSPSYKLGPTIRIEYVLARVPMGKRHYNVWNNLLAQELGLIERKDNYSLEDLFQSLHITPTEVAEVLEIPEKTVTNFRNGLPTSVERIQLVLRFFSWIFQTKFTPLNVRGIQIQEFTDSSVVERLLNGEI